MNHSGQPPVALRNALEMDLLLGPAPWDRNIVLGSFWPNSHTNFESSLVKTFKECFPTGRFQPHISQLCRFYADLILNALDGEHFDRVIRVLSSAEREPCADRPMSLLTDLICSRTGAREATDMFFRTETRPPMRAVGQLGGREALSTRVRYVTQDLFLRPRSLGGSVLLLDDIQNLGASMRAYGWALRRLADAERVVCINLAATRFSGGKDGLGMLKLDTSALRADPTFAEVWADCNGLWHTTRECPALGGRSMCKPRFAAERQAAACPECAKRSSRRSVFSLWKSRG